MVDLHSEMLPGLGSGPGPVPDDEDKVAVARAHRHAVQLSRLVDCLADEPANVRVAVKGNSFAEIDSHLSGNGSWSESGPCARAVPRVGDTENVLLMILLLVVGCKLGCAE